MRINTFRAFRNRNYQLYFCGQSVSQIGTWMQRTAVSWLIYTMTHSTLMLGASVFASQFPSFVFSLYGGVISDRFNRYNIVLITQSVAMIQGILLTVLVFWGHYTVWEILALSVVLGISNAFDVPARLPMVHEMVNDKDDLANAIALNSSMNNLARLAGPALSGLVLAKYGAGFCFLLNALSFLCVILSLLLMKMPPYVPSGSKRNFKTEYAAGFAYLKSTPEVGMVILMLTCTSFLVLPYNTLLPVFAQVVFKGNAATFGYISSFIGLGAFIGAYFLASLKPGADLKKVLFFNTLILGAGLILFSRISSFPLAMLFAVCCGFGTMSQTAVSNTIVQIASDKLMRGRVISYLTVAVYGMLPLGSLLIGFISKHIGAPACLLCTGIMAILITALFSKFLLNKSTLQQKKSII